MGFRVQMVPDVMSLCHQHSNRLKYSPQPLARSGSEYGH